MESIGQAARRLLERLNAREGSCAVGVSSIIPIKGRDEADMRPTATKAASNVCIFTMPVKQQRALGKW